MGEEMAGLFDQFVRHYYNSSSPGHYRRQFEESWQGIDRSNEVQAIKDYLLKPGVGVSYLNQNVATKLCKWPFTLKFASVFCHQKPRVTRTVLNKNICPSDNNQCELGDLFVLFILLRNGIDLEYAAGSIFQAKLYNKIDNNTQQALYDLDIDYDVPSYLKNRPNSPGPNRKMPGYGEGRANAFRYLILNPDDDVEKIFARRTPWPIGYSFRWSTFLDGLLSGADGLPIFPGAASPTNWDIIAEDLLHMSANIPSKKPPRGNDIATQVATQFFNNFSHLRNTRVEGDLEQIGMPTLMIIANSPEEYFEIKPKMRKKDW